MNRTYSLLNATDVGSERVEIEQRRRLCGRRRHGLRLDSSSNRTDINERTRTNERTAFLVRSRSAVSESRSSSDAADAERVDAGAA
jgi:hypothetical protein